MVTDSRGGASQKISKRWAKKHDLLVKQKKMLVTGEWQVFILDDASMGYFAVMSCSSSRTTSLTGSEFLHSVGEFRGPWNIV